VESERIILAAPFTNHVVYVKPGQSVHLTVLDRDGEEIVSKMVTCAVDANDEPIETTITILKSNENCPVCGKRMGEETK
jgi:hypothetical protein